MRGLFQVRAIFSLCVLLFFFSIIDVMHLFEQCNNYGQFVQFHKIAWINHYTYIAILIYTFAI